MIGILTAALAVSVGGTPGVAAAAALEWDARPVALRSDFVLLANERGGTGPNMWDLCMTAPVWRPGGWEIGPLVGVGQVNFDGDYSCPLMGACVPPTPPIGPNLQAAPSALLGFTAVRRSGPWRVAVSPWALVNGRLGWLQPLVGLVAGPPLLEVGAELVPGFELVARTGLAPFALRARF